MKPADQPIPPPPPIRADGKPPGIVEKRIGKDHAGSVVLTGLEGANFHARDLL